jgi:16S rRNA C967 or C1407 C5-methylase (RsmB/RsmF family)
MLTNEFRIARVQKTLRWFEEDIPLLDMRVQELSAERQELARRFAAAVIEQTRAELEMLLQQQSDDRLGSEDSHCEPAD